MKNIYLNIYKPNLHSLRKAKKKLKHIDLLKSCDVGLSTVVLKKSIIKKNKSIYTDIENVKNSITRTLKREKKADYAHNTLSNLDMENDWKNLANNNVEYLNNLTSTLGGSFNTIGKNNTLIKELSRKS